MFESLKKKRSDEREGGFTLIELLVVIAILGILAAIVVFSVAGVTDKGQLSSCKIDTQTLQTAEEANLAENLTGAGAGYVSMAQLQTDGFLSTQSALHTVVLNPSGAAVPSYYIAEGPNGTCGISGHAVSANVPNGAMAPAGSAACTNNPGAGALSATNTPGWGDC